MGLLRNSHLKKAEPGIVKEFKSAYVREFGSIPDGKTLLNFVKLRNYNFATYDFLVDGSAFEAVDETCELEKYFRGLQEIN